MWLVETGGGRSSVDSRRGWAGVSRKGGFGLGMADLRDTQNHNPPRRRKPLMCPEPRRPHQLLLALGISNTLGNHAIS